MALGSTTGARSRPYTVSEPRYARELYGARLDHVGLDRSEPTFRERDINKRGYRQSSLLSYYGVEHVSPMLLEYDASLRAGASDYGRFEIEHTEFIALPELMDGFFDHSLEVSLHAGYITRDIAFLPFMGGGQLYSQSTPEYNTSVGFVGYPFYSVRGESMLNLSVTYRAPLLRRIGFDMGPLFLEDLYAQVFSSWGNIWGFNADGSRQLPFASKAPNGRYLLGDVGLDLRLGSFFQEIETNVGATLRVVYRLVPFARCPDTQPYEDCLAVTGSRGLLFYAIVGGGF